MPPEERCNLLLLYPICLAKQSTTTWGEVAARWGNTDFLCNGSEWLIIDQREASFVWLVNKQHKRALHSLGRSSRGLRHGAQPGTSARSLEMSICVREHSSYHPWRCWGCTTPAGVTLLWEELQDSPSCTNPTLRQRVKCLQFGTSPHLRLVKCVGVALQPVMGDSAFICSWTAVTAHLRDGLTQLQLNLLVTQASTQIWC